MYLHQQESEKNIGRKKRKYRKTKAKYNYWGFGNAIFFVLKYKLHHKYENILFHMPYLFDEINF